MGNVAGFTHHYGESLALKIKLPAWLSHVFFIRLSEDGYSIIGIVIKIATCAAALMLLIRTLVPYPDILCIHTNWILFCYSNRDY